MKKILKIKSLLLWATLLILIDQGSKALIRATLELSEVYRPDLPLSQTVRLVHLQNYGALGGVMRSYGWLLSILMALISLAILFFYGRVSAQNKAVRAGMILLFAGGVGNLIDRLLFGAVTDFISILSLPVLNIADLYVIIGLVAVVLGWDDSSKQKSPRASASTRVSGEASSSEEARQ